MDAGARGFFHFIDVMIGIAALLAFVLGMFIFSANPQSLALIGMAYYAKGMAGCFLIFVSLLLFAFVGILETLLAIEKNMREQKTAS